jgi:hypothetical protein
MEPTDEFPSVHDAYVACGPERYYREHGHDYRNPHEPVIRELIDKVARDWPVDWSHVLDLAAGSGEVSLAAPADRIDAIDPYTFAAYEARTGRPCERHTFEDIAAGALQGRQHSVVVCSFAMHLVAESRLPALCWALRELADQLLILTPHKRPEIRRHWCWKMTHEMLHQRVRARLYTGV